ncbi:MAG: hypothetical protein HY273_00210 [Gammaproteobacteria bacterium]|nr:hypothetical protein [Gammaproteobacteria bacterium]
MSTSLILGGDDGFSVTAVERGIRMFSGASTTAYVGLRQSLEQRLDVYHCGGFLILVPQIDFKFTFAVSENNALAMLFV